MNRSMDNDVENELAVLLLQSRGKIWEDKRRLGLLREKHTSGKLVGTLQKSPVHVKHSRREECNLCDHVQETEEESLISCSPGFGQQEYEKSPRSTVAVPNDLRSCQKDELISKLTTTEGLTGLRERRTPVEKSHQNTTPLPSDLRSCQKDELISRLITTEGLRDLGEIQTTGEGTGVMVRFGEYSPQNPSLLSPGKTLLGLGEYEEKRRQILERKKREYLEQMTQARHSVKDAVSRRYAELSQQQESSEIRLRSYINMKSTAGTQTDLQITDYIQDAVSGGSVSPVIAATQTPGGEVSVLPSLSPYPQVMSIATQTSGSDGKPSSLKSVPTSDTSADKGIVPLPQHASYLPLNPRERKMVEFKESYSPSFVQGRLLDMTMDHTPDLRHRRKAYQEELRRQIEEKQRIEAEQQKKEQEEEKAIVRRAELQLERMRQEYVQEEAVERERRLQRLRQAEEFQHRQEALKLEAELVHETGARQTLEKRFEDLEPGLAQSLGVSLSVPTLRAKYSSKSPKETAPSGHTSPSINHDLPQDVTDLNTKNSDTSSRLQSDNTHNIAEAPQRDSNVEYPLNDRNVDCTQLSDTYLPQVNNAEYPFHSSNTEYPLDNYSVGKETSETTTISYHRPRTEIIKAAGYSSSVRNCRDGDHNTDALKLPESTARHSEVPAGGVQHVSSLQSQYANKCKNKLDDSLPIPILRAPSPVIPAVTLGQAAPGSDAMRKLEGKWQVPAVERNFVRAKSNPNNILTQLGAVRHQLQLEQLRMEQYLQQQLKNKS